MSVVRFIVVAVIFVALLFVSLDNAQMVTLRFFRLYTLESPLIFVVLCAFAIGAALGLTAGALRTARARRELKRLRRELAGRGADTRTVPGRTGPPYDAV
ncbi:MAG TPA: LapA family protein [Casimicrobiaceae bacterium]|jgi:uncharacterized integral membrane protein